MLDIVLLSNIYMCFTQQSCGMGIVSYAVADWWYLKIVVGLST